MTTAHDIDRDTPAAADIRAREAADKRISLSRKECMTEGGWGASSQRLKEQTAPCTAISTVPRSGSPPARFTQHLIDLANAPPRQGRKPSATSFQKKKRQPTPAELDGLKRANNARHEEKVQRGGRPRQAVRV